VETLILGGNMAQQISLGEFVKLLAALLHQRGVKMPFRNEQPWHLLFYELSKTNIPQKPEFLEHLRFDWDGSYPKSQELSEFLQALHWTASVSASNPHYDIITLPEELATIWTTEFERLNDEIQQLIQRAAERAQEEFVQAVNNE
jgi:hypothetical protein